MAQVKRILFPLIPVLFSILSLLLVTLFLYQSPTKSNKYLFQLNFQNADYAQLYQISPEREVFNNNTYIQDIYNVGLWGYNTGTTGKFHKVNGTSAHKRFRFNFTQVLERDFNYDTLSEGETVTIGNTNTVIVADKTNSNRSWRGIYGGFVMSIITLIFVLATYVTQLFINGPLVLGLLGATLGLNIGQFILLFIGILYTRWNVNDLYNDFKTRQILFGIVAKKGTQAAGWAAMCFSLFALIGFFVWLVMTCVANYRGRGVSSPFRGRGKKKSEFNDNSSFVKSY